MNRAAKVYKHALTRTLALLEQRLQTKTGWGRNEVMTQAWGAALQALEEELEDLTGGGTEI